MKKLTFKSLTLALTLTLILTTCFLGGAFAVSAVADDSNATVTQNTYNDYDVNTEEEILEKVGDLSKSLIADDLAYYYSGTSFVKSVEATNGFQYLTDGMPYSTWFNQNFYKNYSYTYDNGKTTYSGTSSRMYYDLSDVHEITEIVLVDASGPANNNLLLPSFEVFLSETASGHLLFDVSELSTSYSVTAESTEDVANKSVVYKITFNEPVDARYVGFEFPENSCVKGSTAVVLYELAVFGTDLYDNATITQSGHDTANVITDTGIDFSKSVIAGKMPYAYNTSTEVSALQTADGSLGDYARLTDGTINSDSTSVFNRDMNNTAMYYSFTNNHKVDKVVLVDFSGWSGDLRLPSFEVYGSLTDKDGDLFVDTNKIAVASCNEAVQPYVAKKSIVHTITFTEPVEVKYLGFKFSNPGCLKGGIANVVVNEIAVFGEEIMPEYTVTTVDGNTSDTYDTSENLIAGQGSTEHFKGLTNGSYALVGVGGENTIWPVNFTYQFDGVYKVDEISVSSDASRYGQGKLRLGEYSIYISDNADDLYNAENLVANVVGETSSYDAGKMVKDVIVFSDDYDTTGSYIGFSIIVPNLDTATYKTASICEFEVEGTKVNTITATAGNGGTVTPAGTTIFETGKTVTVNVAANDGYKLDEVTVNGVKAELTDGAYTFDGTAGQHILNATFFLIGDTNNDGSLNETDLTVIKQHILEISTANAKYADLDGDGDIDLLDLVTAYEIQQGTSPAVTSLMTALELTNVEYNAALDRASAYNTSATDTARLNAVFEKAKNGGEITVAAIGGSITEGAGNDVITNVSVSPESLGAGTAFENSKYVDRVVNWFDTTFENATVNKVNAGISGTPSFFGTFRLEHDVLQYNPDLVIVEFSVNDLGNYQLDDGYMLDAYESVIRKCLDKGCAVIAVFTVNNLTYTSTNIGNSWQTYHKAIADHYNIPTISYHNAIYPNNEWITEWTKLSGDNVHPNVAGHALLANCITSYFEDVLEYESHTTAAVPTEWYHNDTFADTAIVYMGDAEFNGMIETASTKYGTIATNAAGTGEESFTVQIPTGATEIYVFYHNVVREDKTDNSGSFYAKLGENAETGAYSTANLSINYSHGEWRRIYDGEALSEDTSLTIRSAADGKALHIISILVVK